MHWIERIRLKQYDTLYIKEKELTPGENEVSLETEIQ